MLPNSKKKAAAGETQAPIPGNRFSRRPKTTAFLILVVFSGFFILLDLGVGIGLSKIRTMTGLVDTRLVLPALDGQPWAEDYFREKNAQKKRWDPLLGFISEDFGGKYINIQGGTRKTYVSKLRGEPVSVYFFGGSTALGTGQRDEYTIASYLVRMAEADGISIKVTNYGQSGWGIWQSVARLQQMLTAGSVPDVAVFYDGFNDVESQFADSSPTPTYIQAPQVRKLIHPTTVGSVTLDFWSLYNSHSATGILGRRLRFNRPQTAPDPAILQQHEDNAISIYLRAVELTGVLSKAYRFEGQFYWQPTLYNKPGEEAVLSFVKKNNRGGTRPGWSQVYEQATSRMKPPVIDLTKSLADVREPVFIDSVHTNELGAKAVAKALYAQLKPKLLEVRAAGY